VTVVRDKEVRELVDLISAFARDWRADHSAILAKLDQIREDSKAASAAASSCAAFLRRQGSVDIVKLRRRMAALEGRS
jgi:hypothetical protein